VTAGNQYLCIGGSVAQLTSEGFVLNHASITKSDIGAQIYGPFLRFRFLLCNLGLLWELNVIISIMYIMECENTKLNKLSPHPQGLFVLSYFLVILGFELRALLCKVGSLPQSVFCSVILKMGGGYLVKYLPALALNLDPPNLSLPSS
jgi:hypothetical protein